jgi:hypothetical protein
VVVLEPWLLASLLWLVLVRQVLVLVKETVFEP